MKLIVERNFEDVSYIVEELDESKNNQKNLYIKGVFIQANQKNRNGRIYEDRILRPVVEKYIKEQVDNGRAIGELEHPQSPSISLERVSHRIVELEWAGNDIIGKALILNTPMGNIAKGLIEGGTKLGVSTRGMGSIEMKNGTAYVKDDFHLATVDIVSDPSAPSAFVNGILEGVEFFKDDKTGILQEKQRALEQELKSEYKSQSQLEQIAFSKMRKFIKSLI